jgi:GNAT superfamily N-acetyltransferase
MEIIVTRPTGKDLIEIENLFLGTIKDTFKREGIDLSHSSDIKPEIKNCTDTLKRDFQSNGQDEYFLIAQINNKIAGTIAYGSVNNIIRNNLDIDFNNIQEIKSAYILPEFQRIGVASKLFKKILIKLHKNKTEEFCLDCGFTISQNFWIKKIGQPTKILKNYFGKDAHHMIWKSKIKTPQN